MRRSRFALRLLVVVVLACGALLVPAAVSAQQIPTHGVSPEAQRPWTYYLTFPLILGAGGLVLLVGASFVRLAPRFYGAEEPPKQPTRRRQVAAVTSGGTTVS